MAIPALWRIFALSVLWFVFIAVMHLVVYAEQGSRQIITMGYMPVVTNMAAPILDKATIHDKKLHFRAVKFSSFAEMAEALRGGNIDAAFIIAPLSIVLRQQGEDVKIVYIGNRHESTMVARKDLRAAHIRDLVGKTVAVPMRYSGHNLSVLNLIEQHDLKGEINVVEMNPPDMAAALAAGVLDAYYVGEPFAAKTLQSGDASRVYYVEEVWPKFICNLTIVRQQLIDERPQAVQKLVNAAARSGIWAQKNPVAAAKIAAEYWNQPVELVEYALTTPDQRIVYDQFMPKQDEMQYMADLMVKHGLASSNDVSGLVEDRFARKVKLDNVTTLNDIVK